MNFFSHAAVAGQFSSDRVFVLGSMLPDFASMIGQRRLARVHPRVDPGVDFHHLTDSAFHENREFQGRWLEASAALKARGLGRGPARAAAHVALELFADQFLAHGERSRRAYLDALHAGTEPWLLATLTRDDDERRKLEGLLNALLERGVPHDSSSALFVERVKRALSRRPRLALAPGDDGRLLDWVESARGAVGAWAPVLLDDLTRELERRMAA